MKSVFLILSFVVSCYGTAQTCTGPLQWPTEAASFSGYSTSDTETDSGYLMEAVEYHTPDDCTCGVLHKWIFVPQADGAIQFQVWDHIDHESYQLKGENYFTVQAAAVGQQLEFFVPERDRITIRNNYLLGWYGATGGIIGYKEGVESYSDEARREPSMGDIDPSNEPIFDWSSGSSVVIPNRIYAIGAEVVSNTAPEFTNLDRTVWIYGDETAGAYIYQIAADDIDSKDVSSLFIYDIAEDSTSNFYYDRTTQIVYLAVSNPAHGTYTMTFEVQDQCLNTNQGVLTILVLNWAPSLTNMPSFATIHEDTTNEVALFTVQFSDKDNTTLANSYTLNIVPSTTNVVEKYVGYDQSNRSIVSKRTASYDYTASQLYTIDLTLTDGGNTTDKGYFLLYITKNDPPKFTNLNNGARANISYASTASGDTVYAVSATDADNDVLTFTITCDPAGCPLTIDGTNGVISTTRDFVGNVYEPGWDVLVTVSDGTNTVGPKALTVINEGTDKRTAWILMRLRGCAGSSGSLLVTNAESTFARGSNIGLMISDINDVPQIVNLGLTDPIAVHEGTALGTTIYTVSYVDLDTADTHTFHATYNPTWATNFFEINSTSGVLTTEHNILDYEKHDTDWTIVVTISVSDTVELVQGTLTILIRNVNEAPSFHQTKYTLEAPDNGAFGVPAGFWDPQMSDPDLDIATPTDTHTYTWDCGIYTRYFRIDKTSAMVTFATKFDYDTVNFTAPYDCVVTVTDKAGLSATTTLEIDIQDENDNSPVFANADYYIFQTPSLDPGRFVGQVTATDIDRSAENNAIYYSFVSITPTLSKDYLLINDFGNIYVNQTWPSSLFDYGISYELVVKAENVQDTTGTKYSATVTATLFISGTTTTVAVTTDRPFKFIEDNRNVAWLTVAVTVGVVLLILVCGFMLMYGLQVKRYRWCIPWCRKRLLGLTKVTRRAKRRYYRGLLMQEELEDMSDESEEDVVRTVLHLGHGDSDDETSAPPMLWDRLKARGGDPVTRGPTVRKMAQPVVPRAAVYDEPKPPMKKDVSKMMKKSDSKFWT